MLGNYYQRTMRQYQYFEGPKRGPSLGRLPPCNVVIVAKYSRQSSVLLTSPVASHGHFTNLVRPSIKTVCVNFTIDLR